MYKCIEIFFYCILTCMIQYSYNNDVNKVLTYLLTCKVFIFSSYKEKVCKLPQKTSFSKD